MTYPHRSLSRRRFALGLAAGASSIALPSHAQNAWPNRPIRLIVPYPPGGFTDQMARLVQPRLQAKLGQTIVIDNKPGANSIIGVDALAKSAPDGYTFGVVIAAYAANTTLYPKLPYDPRKDLVGVAPMASAPLLAAVFNQAAFKTVAELVDHARRHPGKISFGSSGTGSAAHLTGELLKAVSRTYMVHIPYRGAAPALSDLIAGQIDLLFDGGAAVLNAGKAGQVRLMGVTSEHRLPLLPQVPTFIEQGVPNFTSSSWAALLAPAGTPRDIVRRMSDEVTEIVRSAESKTRLDAMVVFASGGTPETCDAFLAAETVKWGRVIQQAGVKLE
jgi:tripartite-type tricarboxylate transporter receptor subunit TctC